MIPLFSAIPAVGKLVKSIFGDKVARDKQGHDEQMAVYNQFSAEFGHAKTWWDSLIDGMNRLVRPAFSFGIVWLFIYCVRDPEGFTIAMLALKNMPYEGWVAMWMILGFWFGTKAIEKMPKRFGKLKLPKPKDDIEWNDRVKKRYSKYND